MFTSLWPPAIFTRIDPLPCSSFGLTLVVNHACNLRCSYCYTGAKFHAPMPLDCGEHAIRRAFASIRPGGALQLGFFGGEPLLEAVRIRHWMRTARNAALEEGKVVGFNLTTNGTLAKDDALAVLMDVEVELAISCDGIAEQHDKHRHDAQGRGSFSQVESSLRILMAAGRPFSVITVVRPDTLARLPASLIGLHALGVTRFTLSLDVWIPWNDADLINLSMAVETLADLWRGWLPNVSIDWFDMRIGAMAGFSPTGTRCAFGEGEIAVAPSGRLYPCKRIVGEDLPGHPLALPGLVSEGKDFLGLRAPCIGNPRAATPGCRCSNFVRTGSTEREDRLFPALNETVQHALERLINATCPPVPNEGRSL